MPGFTREPDPATTSSARDRAPLGAQRICAGQIMSAPVISVCPDTPLRRAIDLMLEAGVSGLPVIDVQGALVGIVTEGDLLRRVELGTERRVPRWVEYLRSPGRLAEEYAHAHGRTVETVMSGPVITVTEDTSVQAIVETMTRGRIKRAPVLRGNSVVGMVSRADVVRALGTALEAGCRPEVRSDAEIHQDILSAFDRADCIPKATIDVAVRQGTVELNGWLIDERERGAVRAAIEGVPGVVAIRDHLTWVEPITGMVLQSPEDAKAAAAGTPPSTPTPRRRGSRA